MRTIFTGLVLAVGLAAVFSVAFVGPAQGLTTSFGQNWNLAPDAWTRGNDVDTSNFGWDNFESNTNPILAGGRVLDDSTVDLAGIILTTAIAPRIFQGNDGLTDTTPTTWGHRSGSGNYYSGPASGAHDSIVATAPASGVGGFTTVVLQLIGTFQPSAGLQFSIDQSLNTWTLEKSLFGLSGDNSGLYWAEYTAAGNDLPFKITFTSSETSIALDAVQVDTFWSADGPAVNARTTVPEPACMAWLAGGMLGGMARLRRRDG